MIIISIYEIIYLAYLESNFKYFKIYLSFHHFIYLFVKCIDKCCIH